MPPLATSASTNAVGDRRNARISRAFTASDRAKVATEPDLLTLRNYDEQPRVGEVTAMVGASDPAGTSSQTAAAHEAVRLHLA